MVNIVESDEDAQMLNSTPGMQCKRITIVINSTKLFNEKRNGNAKITNAMTLVPVRLW